MFIERVADLPPNQRDKINNLLFSEWERVLSNPHIDRSVLFELDEIPLLDDSSLALSGLPFRPENAHLLKRSRRIPIDQILDEETIVDTSHVDGLKKNIQINGLASPIDCVVRALDNKLYYRVFDGMHRLTALRSAGETEVDCNIVFGVSNEIYHDWRVLAAKKSEGKVRYVRMGTWMQRSWSETPWVKVASLSRFANFMVNQNRQGTVSTKLPLTERDLDDATRWFKERADAWGLSYESIRDSAIVMEFGDPQLLKKIVIGGGRANELNPTRALAIVTHLKNSKELQWKVAQVVLKLNLSAVQVHEIARAINNERDNPIGYEWILSHARELFSKGALIDIQDLLTTHEKTREAVSVCLQVIKESLTTIEGNIPLGELKIVVNSLESRYTLFLKSNTQNLSPAELLRECLELSTDAEETKKKVLRHIFITRCQVYTAQYFGNEHLTRIIDHLKREFTINDDPREMIVYLQKLSQLPKLILSKVLYGVITPADAFKSPYTDDLPGSVEAANEALTGVAGYLDRAFRLMPVVDPAKIDEQAIQKLKRAYAEWLGFLNRG